jgi:hypothetical protein
LWNRDTKTGVFSTVSPTEQRQIASQESRFARDVLTAYPTEVLLGLGRNIFEQGLQWNLDDFNLSPNDRNELSAKLPANVKYVQNLSLAFRGRMPVHSIELLNDLLAVLSLFIVAWLLIARASMDSATRLFIVVILLGFFADIVVCGALSTPHGRYLMRVAWLLPLAAFLCASRQRMEWPFARESSDGIGRAGNATEVGKSSLSAIDVQAVTQQPGSGSAGR